MRPKSTTLGIIFLSRGLVAIVDPEDFETLNAHYWFAMKAKQTFYAVRNIRTESGQRTSVLMHRQLTGAPADAQVDHRDGNGLNNSRTNLRIATPTQNSRNRWIGRKNTSGYKGVSFDGQTGRWRAQIDANCQHHNIGRFNTPEEAAKAYDLAARELHGAFARPNFPKPALG